MDKPVQITELSQQLMNISMDSARQVGPYLTRVFKDGIDAEEKKGYFDLVTEADRTAEALLSEHLTRAYPDSCIIGEENGEQGSGSVSWIIDPIDGTNNFVSGIPFFCISIGAVYNGQVIAGVIYDPMRDEMFSASMEGAFLNGEKFVSKGHLRDSSSLLLTGFPYEGGSAVDEDFSYYQKIISSFHAVRRLGSTALEMAYVAIGRADVTFQTNANPWDVTAGLFIIQQAGGHYYVPSENGETNGSPWKSPRFVGASAGFQFSESVLRHLLERKEWVH
jgi:myo-inositol-1(or 4)-monophosphatase